MIPIHRPADSIPQDGASDVRGRYLDRLIFAFNAAELGRMASGVARPQQQVISTDGVQQFLQGASGVGFKTISATTGWIKAQTSAALIELDAGSDWTFQCVVDNYGSSGANPGFFRVGTSANGTTFVLDNGGARRPFVRVNGSNVLSPGAGATWTAGQTLNLIVRFKNGAWVDAWWSGKPQHRATHAVSQDALTGSNAIYALGQQSGSDYVSGSWPICRFWGRALSDEETAELANVPAAFWEIHSAVPEPVSAGGSSVSLTVADATHGHAVDSLVLTSSTALSVAEATHTHAADSITLVVGSVLTVAEASHAHAADSLTLTAASALAVADATHAHAADNITLSVAGATNLTVADALHGHAADALALTSAHALIVADATHAHTVDGLTLTAASVLAIQEALHAHAADNITLDASGAVNLLLADGLHAHTADGVALTVAAWLTVADALHGHAADNVVLTFGGAVVEPLARYTIAAKARRLTITAAARRLEIRK